MNFLPLARLSVSVEDKIQGEISLGLNAILFLNKWGLTGPDSLRPETREIQLTEKHEEPQATALTTQPRALGAPGMLKLALPEATEERMAGFPRSSQRENRELCAVFQKNLELWLR